MSNDFKLFKKKPSVKIIGIWSLYGLVSSLALNFLFPHFLMGTWREAIFIGAFLIMGCLDFVASSISYKKQRSVKLV